MRAILLAILFGFCIYCSHAETATTVGSCDNYSLLGGDRIFEPAKNNRVQTTVIKFPKVKTMKKKIIILILNSQGKVVMQFQGVKKSDVIIRGFRHINYKSVPANVTIVDGKLGEGRIWIKIISQPGYAIKSIFEFCGERN